MSDQDTHQNLVGAVSRRTFPTTIAITSGSVVAACHRPVPVLPEAPVTAFDNYDTIIIGTGFGATLAATQLALLNPHKRENILMFEPGVWWFTPERHLPACIKINIDKEPVQYWPRPDHGRGVLDSIAAARTNSSIAKKLRPCRNLPHPLYRYHSFDEIDILSASGVGGGSLVYSNVTIEPHFDTATQSYSVLENWPLLRSFCCDRAIMA